MAYKELHVVIVGAGLAGLTAAIHLSKAKFKVTLIEKESFPMHKVCGEYISNEVMPYLRSLDLDMDAIGAIAITKLKISTQKGAVIRCDLPLGGFGISRYTLDHYLWKEVVKLGATTIQDEVNMVRYDKEIFEVKTVNNQRITADFVIGAYGKRSALDYALKRDFEVKNAPWLGVKGHYRADIPGDTVQLHNFKGGYCGISEVENGIVNVCYLAHYTSFKRYKSIPKFQDAVVFGNPFLRDFFEQAVPVFEKPLTIAQINFMAKKSVEHHMLMCGDAAGLIHPLCGNGMAMAIAGAQLVSDGLIAYAKGDITTRLELEKNYAALWQQKFSNRLFTGHLLQKVLLHPTMQIAAQKTAKFVPSIVPNIVRRTHGVSLRPAII